MNLKILKQAAIVARRERLPLFAIGGISRENLSQVKACGVERVAVCRDILLRGSSTKDIRFSVGELKRLLKVS
jgi:thiamine monophosphate synthase